jgi:hypothetical protein
VSAGGRPCPRRRTPTGQRRGHRRGAARAPRSDGGRRATWPAPSPGPDGCAVRPAAHAPRRARGSSAAAEARDQRHRPGTATSSSFRQPPRHRVGRHTGVAAGNQERVEASHRGQATSDRPGRQARLSIAQPDHRPVAALVSQEVEHISRDNIGRLLLDNREEPLEVERHRPERVRPGPASHELQVAVDEWMAKRQAPLTRRRRGPDETRDERHPRTMAATTGNHGDTTWITRVLGDKGRRPLDYVALPPISPTIAPKPILDVVEQVSAAALT